jgi:hypothetical protein
LLFSPPQLRVSIAQVKLQIAVEHQNAPSGSASHKPPRANLFPDETDA